MSRKRSLNTMNIIAIIGVVFLLAACGGIDPEQDRVNPEGAESTYSGLSNDDQAEPQPDAFDADGNPLMLFNASTIDRCEDHGAELQQKFCVLHDRCPGLCESVGYELLSGPKAQGCVAEYQVACLCVCKGQSQGDVEGDLADLSDQSNDVPAPELSDQ